MYLPPQFKSSERALAAALMRAHPFASLVSVDDDGLPFVTHIPLVLEDRAAAGEADAQFVLLGHVAKPNPHWRYLQARPRAVVTFLGPHAYLSPSVYPDLARVPTWNYLVAHAYGTPRVVDDEDRVRAGLRALVAEHEAAFDDPWPMDLGDDYLRKMVRGIVAFEIPIARLEGKFKLSQNRSPADRARVIAALAESDDPSARGVGERMRTNI